MALTPGPEEAEFNNWYGTKFKPAMERGPLDKYVARQAWFAATAPLLARIAELERKEGLRKELHTTANKMIAERNERIEALTAQVEQAAQPVAVYQYQYADGSWGDQTKDSHDYNVRHGQATVRVLYTSPPKATPLTDEQRKVAIGAAMNALDSDINISWRNALIDAVEQAHGITPATVEKGGE